MSHFLDYAIPGVPYGCDFALMAVGLVLTFRATGVFNLAFGAQAFTGAFIFDLLVTAHHVNQWVAFMVAVLVVSPLLGLAFDRFLFRVIPTASTTAKVVTALGLLIAIPQAIPIIFRNTTSLQTTGFWLDPGHVYLNLAGSPVNGGQLSTTVVTLAVAAALVAMLRFTAFGLEMRAVVESRRLAQLEGINSKRTAAWAWVLSSVLAGLAGVLMLPLSGGNLVPSQPLQFTTLLVFGLTAAAVASVRSIPIALVAGIGLGILQNLITGYLPNSSILSAQNVKEALPFAVLAGVLLFNRELRTIEVSSDPLAACDPPPPLPAVAIRDPRLSVPMTWGFRLVVVGFLVSAATWVPDYWVTALASGLVLSVIFLSITLITGMGGWLSLCQASFAGLGAFTAGELAAHLNLPVLLGALVGALAAATTGAVIALVAARLSGLLLALFTLAFALFADGLLFNLSWLGGGNTVVVPRPQIGPVDFSRGDRNFLGLAFVVLVVCAILVKLIQRGTTGMVLAALRGSPTAAASLGISMLRQRVIIFTLSAGMAGLGGALYGSLLVRVSSLSYLYVYSLAFVVVVITTGSRSVEGAVNAGMSYAVLLLILQTYFPHYTGLEPILFAFGAMTYAAHPEGIVEYQKTRWLNRVARALQALDARRARTAGPDPAGPQPATVGGDISGA